MTRQELYKLLDSLNPDSMGCITYYGSKKRSKEYSKNLPKVTISASNHAESFRKIDCFGKPLGAFYVRDLVIERIEGKARDIAYTVTHKCRNHCCVNYSHFEIRNRNEK